MSEPLRGRVRSRRPKGVPPVPPEVKDWLIPWLHTKLQEFADQADTQKRMLKIAKLPQIEANLRYLQNCQSAVRTLIYHAGGRPRRPRKRKDANDGNPSVGTTGGIERGSGEVA